MTRTLLLTAVVGLATCLAPAPAVQAQDMEPIVYMTRYKINPARIDSLTTLTAMFDAPWHNFVASRVPGYQRSHYRHDTGDDYNYVIMTTYPDWDYVRGDEIDYDTIGEAFEKTPAYTDMESQGMTEEQIEAMFDWAYEGSSHTDNIMRPITAQ